MKTPIKTRAYTRLLWIADRFCKARRQQVAREMHHHRDFLNAVGRSS